jgi:hypothetical protein
MGRLAVATCVVGLAAALEAAPGVATSKRVRPRMTMIGDSVSASLTYVSAARRYLNRSYRVRYDLKVCRRLVAASCVYQGVRPSTALQAASAYGRALGGIVVVDVGYNEGASTYRAGLDVVMRVLVRSGVRTVVWVTLRETTANYRAINSVIRHAGKRYRRLRVADWNAWSAGRPWFGSDGLHLNAAGAMGLAHLIRNTARA